VYIKLKYARTLVLVEEVIASENHYDIKKANYKGKRIATTYSPIKSSVTHQRFKINLVWTESSNKMFQK